VMCGRDRPSKVSTPMYPDYISKSGHHGGTFAERIAFIDAIEGKPSTAATVSEGFWSVVVGIAAEQSVKSGQPVVIADMLSAAGVSVDR